MFFIVYRYVFRCRESDSGIELMVSSHPNENTPKWGAKLHKITQKCYFSAFYYDKILMYTLILT